MEIISDKEIDKGKLSVSFTDGELVMIAKIYSDMTGKPADPARMTHKQINTVVNKILKEFIKDMKKSSEE